jgi:acetate kinase
VSDDERPVLVCDPGSSSLRVTLVAGGDRVVDETHVEQPPDSGAAGAALDGILGRHPTGELLGVGYRLVHGGSLLTEPARASDDLLAGVRALTGLAPLHMPPALALVDDLRARLPDAHHVLCPDTAFHAGLPEVAAAFALPAEWRERHGLRRYGFHGLSYTWALRRAGQLLGRDPSELQLVLAHLGGGSSVTAVRHGTSVDTSMAMTPLDGVPMSTRSGALDPGLLLWLLEERGMSTREAREGLYRRSGLLGLSGRSGDTRDLVAAAVDGDHTSEFALNVFAHRVRREIAACAASLDRLDALVFTGEIGWDQPEVRMSVCAGLALLGVEPPDRAERDDDGPVSAPGAGVPVLVVETHEELEIARQTRALLTGR